MTFLAHPTFSADALAPAWAARLPVSAEVCLFGGAVRDACVGQPARDHDFLVAGATPDEMAAAGLTRAKHAFIERYTYADQPLDEVMRSTFPGTPQASMTAMLWTRDLTVHALGWDLKRQAWLDPTALGKADLQARVFRMTTPEVADDPVVLLRWARLAVLFQPHGFTMDEATWQRAVMQTQAQGFADCDIFRLNRQVKMIQASGVAPAVWGSLQAEGLQPHLAHLKALCLAFQQTKQAARAADVAAGAPVARPRAHR